MSDVLIVCSKCAHECKVSEYASSGEISCPSCGEKLTVPRPSEIKKLSRLSLRSAEETRLIDDAEERAREEELRARNRNLNPDAMTNVHVRREKIKTPRSVWGWLLFLLLSAGFVALLYFMDDREEFAIYYMWMRVGVGLLTLGLALLSAFEDSTIQGIFCIFIPGYIVYHVFVRSDSYALRGMLMSIIVAMGAELHFLGDQSTIVIIQNYLNSVIAGGGALIDKASDAPTF